MTTIFTDGASSGNPGPGGWGAIIVNVNKVIELGGHEKDTTNNRMELRAVIEALGTVYENVKNKKNSPVIIYTDSSYVKRGATEWLSKWESTDWKTKTKKEVLNKDLWLQLREVMAGMESSSVKIEWKLLGGHIGISGNERADVIATANALKKPVSLYTGDLKKYEKVVLGGKGILNIDHNAELKEKKSSSRGRSGAKAYSYVSMVNGVIQTHKTWEECEKRVKGVAARFKKATSPEEEREIIAEFQSK